VSVSIHDQLKCAKRELALRRNNYPTLIACGCLTEGKAAREVSAMTAIVETLSLLAAREPEWAA
jgi:hypothetical protein